jgi:hypothetical protein
MAKKPTVNLHVFTMIDGEMFAVCQVRGGYAFQDPARPNIPNTWTGALEPLASGELVPGENFEQAINRVIDEMLGYAFHSEMPEYKREGRPVHCNGSAHWSVTVEPGFLSQFILFHIGTGGIHFLQQWDLRKILNRDGYDPLEQIPADSLVMDFDEKVVMTRLWPRSQT